MLEVSEEVTAGGTAAAGAGTEVAANDIGTTPTESVGDGQAVSGSETEPLLYEVQVDGRAEKVTFEELQKGYMRQADYTRKTQSVAKDREGLAQLQTLATALENNPRGTLVALAGALGVDFGQAAQAFAPTGATGDEEDPIVRLERGFQTLSQQLSAREQAETQSRDNATRQAQVKAQIDNELVQLHADHGDFPDMELIQYAVDRGINNLDHAHRMWRFDALEAQRIAEQNAATDAKRRAQIVSGGSNPQTGAIVTGTAGAKPTIREAWQQAVAAHRS